MAEQTDAGSFTARVEDHALTRVPESERRSGWGLMMNTAGIATTLVQLAIAATVSGMVGVKWAIIAGVLVSIFGAALGWLMGHVAYVSGTSSTVTTRYYGLGHRGSILASLVFAFMILGFLALENALLYFGTLFMFGMAPTLINAVIIYGIFTIVWILLTMYGLPVVQRTSTFLLVLFVALTIAVAVLAVMGSHETFGQILASGRADPTAPLGPAFTLVIAILAGSAGALALVDADYARFARSTKDVGILAVGGSIAIDIVVVILGSIIGHASTDSVMAFLQANPAIAATQPGATIADKIQWMLQNDAGAYFIILAGITGFILMYVAQVKAQVLNTYSGSLCLSNLGESISGHNIGRLAMVIIGNIIALIMIALNILGLIASYLGILGTTTVAIAGVVIADYFIVRRCTPAMVKEMEEVNWAGVISVVIAVIVGTLLADHGITPLGFIISLIIVLILYPLLRVFVLRAPRRA